MTSKRSRARVQAREMRLRESYRKLLVCRVLETDLRVTMPKPPRPQPVALRIELLEVVPLVWRRVLVSSHWTLASLHHYLQWVEFPGFRGHFWRR